MHQETIVPSQALVLVWPQGNECVMEVVADNKTLMALFSDSDTFTSATNIFALP